MKILVSLVALLVGLTACGTAATPSSQSHASSTSRGASAGAAASPGGSSGALFAVLEGAAPNVSQANTVAIEGPVTATMTPLRNVRSFPNNGSNSQISILLTSGYGTKDPAVTPAPNPTTRTE